MITDPAIDVDEVERALLHVLDAVRARHGGRLSLPGDHSWELPVDAAFDLSRPTELTVGQLTEDLESLTDLLDRDADEPVAVWHELGHLIGVLRAVALVDRPRPV